MIGRRGCFRKPYDQNVNRNDIYAPAQTNIKIRSQSERNVTAADILSSKQARERAISNHQRVDIEKFTGFFSVHDKNR